TGGGGPPPARAKNVRKSKVALSPKCTPSTPRTSPQRGASALSTSAPRANSRSRRHPSPRPPVGGPPWLNCGSSRSTSARTYGGAIPPMASRTPPLSLPPTPPTPSLIRNNGSLLSKGKQPPPPLNQPSAAARRMPSPANRVLPTPASPTTSTSRVSPPSATRKRDNSRSRPTNPTGPAIHPAHQPAYARSIPSQQPVHRRPERGSFAERQLGQDHLGYITSPVVWTVALPRSICHFLQRPGTAGAEGCPQLATAATTSLSHGVIACWSRQAAAVNSRQYRRELTAARAQRARSPRAARVSGCSGPEIRSRTGSSAANWS